MTTTNGLAAALDHYGTLKSQLVQYATGPIFQDHLTRFAQLHEDALQQGHIDLQAVVDQFVFNFRFDNDATMAQRFAADQQVNQRDAVLLQAMDEGFQAFFEILQQDHEADALRIKCCFSDLEYTLMPTLPGGLSDPELAAGGFMSARITEVPGAGVWTPSGSLSVLPAASGSQLVELVRQQSMQHPEFSHRNPAYRQIALERSQRIHEYFVAAHGGHTLYAPILQLVDAYVDAQLAPAADNVPSDQREATEKMLRASILDSELIGQRDVMLHSHPLAGLSFYSQIAELNQLLYLGADLNPDEVERLRSFIQDDSTPAWLLGELVTEQLPFAEQALSLALDRPGFSWQAEGELFLDSLPSEREPSLQLAIHSEFCRSL
ncbi:hypothetical protein [Glutamicibacter sp.]|uniref:hypothetical protein n=1 Tax=Glutamicibacter sp. TaxID=1931995 RepID=UPI0028BF1989|nr:hypothetical protein [Glutamicibacter sp.]